MRKRHSIDRNKLRPDSEIPYPESKRCSRCGEVRAASEFPRSRRENDGLKSWCKPCSAEGRADWYRRNAEDQKAKTTAYQKANPEKAAAWHATSMERHGAKYNARKLARYHENGEVNRSERRKRYASNPDVRASVLAAQAVSYRRDPESAKRRVVAWRAVNRDKTRYYATSYRARRLGAEGDCSAEEWAAILAYFNHRCAYCHRPASEVGTLAQEHMLPLSRRGTNHARNIVPSCQPCNSSKRHRTPLEWISGMSVPLRHRRKEAAPPSG
jgi:hypothetical protein